MRIGPAVKLRICTSFQFALKPWPLIGDEVSHFYDILIFFNIFFKELLEK